jgi:hypothetical protein
VKLAVMLRLAAALDRSRAQLVDSVGVELAGGQLRLRVRARGNCEVELWAAERQAALLERVFGRSLHLAATTAPEAGTAHHPRSAAVPPR